MVVNVVPHAAGVNEILEDALRLAASGIPCFPCQLANKRPLPGSNGFKDATADPDQLKQLWQRYPGGLIGVPTGAASGLFVLDIDSAKHPEADEWLERHSARLPETRLHRTRSGGLHLLFKHQDGLRNSESKLAPGVDTRGEGGYIIWWPFHLGLNSGHNFLPPARAPEWLVEALKPPAPTVIPFPSLPRFNSGPAICRVDGIIATVAQAREGTRNALTFWGACKLRDMIANRELDYGAARQAFNELISASRRTGLPNFEIRRTIASATRGLR
jgi:hypothetical protein